MLKVVGIAVASTIATILVLAVIAFNVFWYYLEPLPSNRITKLPACDSSQAYLLAKTYGNKSIHEKRAELTNTFGHDRFNVSGIMDLELIEVTEGIEYRSSDDFVACRGKANFKDGSTTIDYFIRLLSDGDVYVETKFIDTN
ncbi:MAG: hypothetical protein DYH13_01710 [Alphaproteobacteria bacterium PRO2]|nr:hypothetical protein [Alphaproteobacteria bacterium PRO2]